MICLILIQKFGMNFFRIMIQENKKLQLIIIFILLGMQILLQLINIAMVQKLIYRRQITSNMKSGSENGL